jgi:outer membrane protein assembly factor BamA
MTTRDEKTQIDEIHITLSARSKTGRYYERTAIRELLVDLNGTLFREGHDLWHLRTKRTQPNGGVEIIVIVFTIEGSRATVVSQTSDHYEWGDYEHVENPPFEFDLESNRTDQ